MYARTCPPDVELACRDLFFALRSRVCVTSVRMRLRHSDHDLRSGFATGSADGPLSGASVRLLIRDDRGIVGDIEITDGCHPTCNGVAIHEMARIVEAYAEPIRRALIGAPTLVAAE